MTQKTINLFYTTIKEPLPDFIYEGLKDYSAGANLYRPQPEELINKLASKHKLPKEMFFLTAGIDEAIQIFAKTYGRNAFVFTPSYVVYTDVEVFGGKLTQLYSIKNNQFKISTGEIKGSSLIFLANPNNPSGITPVNRLIELIKNNPQAMVVIDEAYGEFANLSVIRETEKFPHLAVFRSFSKAYGMAGNRIGYVVANEKIISEVKNKTQWANVSYLSVGAAMAALNHEAYFQEMRQGINQRRDDFDAFLTKSGFTLIKSNINAVLLKFSSVNLATRFASYLKDNQIIVSHGGGLSNIGLDQSFVRIAIGTQEQMDQVKKVITEFKAN